MKTLPYNYKWIGVLFSPFRLPRISIYFGPIKIGAPYFLPRKFVERSKKEALKEALDEYNRYKDIHSEGSTPFSYFYKKKKSEKVAKPIAFGVKVVPLGWKTKWGEVRHEWDPAIHFVFFNRQLVISAGLKNAMANMCYWEAWLTYDHINKKIYKKTALRRAILSYTATWAKDDEVTNYWFDILKKKHTSILRGDRVYTRDSIA